MGQTPKKDRDGKSKGGSSMKKTSDEMEQITNSKIQEEQKSSAGMIEVNTVDFGTEIQGKELESLELEGGSNGDDEIDGNHSQSGKEKGVLEEEENLDEEGAYEEGEGMDYNIQYVSQAGDLSPRHTDNLKDKKGRSIVSLQVQTRRNKG